RGGVTSDSHLMGDRQYQNEVQHRIDLVRERQERQEREDERRVQQQMEAQKRYVAHMPRPIPQQGPQSRFPMTAAPPPPTQVPVHPAIPTHVARQEPPSSSQHGIGHHNHTILQRDRPYPEELMKAMNSEKYQREEWRGQKEREWLPRYDPMRR